MYNKFGNYNFKFLSIIGTTLATSSKGKLSSEGSESDPSEESPSPVYISFLLSKSSFSKKEFIDEASVFEPKIYYNSCGIWIFA